MKKLIFFSVFFASLILVFPGNVFAKRLLPQTKAPAGIVASKSRGVGLSVRFRSDRRAVVMTVSNMTIANSITYNLSYNTNGTTQGVSGTIIPSQEQGTITRELVFGTASNGIYRYDTNITNAKLVVTSVLKNGVKIVRTFKLKV